MTVGDNEMLIYDRRQVTMLHRWLTSAMLFVFMIALWGKLVTKIRKEGAVSYFIKRYQ